MARRHPCAEARANETDLSSKPKRPGTGVTLVLGCIEKSFLCEILEPREVRGPCSIDRGKPHALHARWVRSLGEIAESRDDLAAVERDPIGLGARARAPEQGAGLRGDPRAALGRLAIGLEPRLFARE